MTRFYCQNLQTVALIIGSLETIGGILGTLICSTFLGLWNFTGQDVKNVDFEEVKKSLSYDIRTKTFDLKYVDEETFHSAAQAWLTFLTIITAIILGISILKTIISSLMIHGIRKKSSLLLTVWIISKCIFITLVSLMFLASLINGFNRVHIVIFLILLGLNTFFIYIVNLFRQQLKAEESTAPMAGNSRQKL